MCGKDKNGALLLAELEPKGKGKVRSGVPGGRRKVSAWTGVRVRHSGKWATEIRVPRTREKVWIGTFESPRQAALAYDAAVFCFYGPRTPKARKINFPAAPRPEISESARLQLSVADMKVISEKHAYEVDALMPPLEDEDSVAATEDHQVAAPATTVVAVDAPCPCACAGGRATTDILDGWDDDALDQMVRAFDIDAYAELEAPTFIVSDKEYYATERSG